MIQREKFLKNSSNPLDIIFPLRQIIFTIVFGQVAYIMQELNPTHPIGPAFEQELLKNASTYIYKKTQDGELRIHLFFPEGHQKEDRRPAFLFFHGGLWDNPMITQFVPQCMHFVSRGGVAATAEYRIAKNHQTTPVEAILDAQTALLWLRVNHSFLGLETSQIVAGGAGSGAHIALCAGMHKEIERDHFYDSRPDALILYSAIVDTTRKGPGVDRFPSAKIARSTSPSKHARKNLPPAIFFHGKEDATSSIETVQKFTTRYRRKRNKCIFSPYSQATHSFFNFNVNRDHYVHTIESADGFVTDLGFLKPDENHYIDPGS